MELMDSNAIKLAKELRSILEERHIRLVLAESCTAGRVAATLAVLPGISQWLCGSLVVYRSSSKRAWLDVPAELLDDPAVGPVSAAVTELLACSALARTPEADWAIAVTGDVGPGAPTASDGCVFMSSARRRSSGDKAQDDSTSAQQVRLTAPTPRDANDLTARETRLDEATRHVLQFALQQILSTSAGEMGPHRAAN